MEWNTQAHLLHLLHIDLLEILINITMIFFGTRLLASLLYIFKIKFQKMFTKKIQNRLDQK
jgi:hypothetical protein